MCTLSMHIHTFRFVFFFSAPLPSAGCHQQSCTPRSTEELVPQNHNVLAMQDNAEPTSLLQHFSDASHNPSCSLSPQLAEKNYFKKTFRTSINTEIADTLSFLETALIFPRCVQRQPGIWKASCTVPCSASQNKSHELLHTVFLVFSASSRNDGLIVKQHFSDEPSLLLGGRVRQNLENCSNLHPSSCTGLHGAFSSVQGTTREWRTASQIFSFQVSTPLSLTFEFRSYS